MGTILGFAALAIGFQGLATDVSENAFPSGNAIGRVFGESFQCTSATIHFAGSSSFQGTHVSDAVEFYHVDLHDEKTEGRRRDVQFRIALDVGRTLENATIAWKPYAEGTPEARRQKTLVSGTARIERGIRWVSIDTYPVGGGFAKSVDFREGFSARLKFGRAKDGFIPGKVIVTLPDSGKSWVAGAFRAEYRPKS